MWCNLESTDRTIAESKSEELTIKLVFETANDDYVVVSKLGDKPGWELVSKGNLPESVISFGDLIARAELDHYSRVKDKKRLEMVEGGTSASRAG